MWIVHWSCCKKTTWFLPMFKMPKICLQEPSTSNYMYLLPLIWKKIKDAEKSALGPWRYSFSLGHSGRIWGKTKNTLKNNYFICNRYKTRVYSTAKSTLLINSKYPSLNLIHWSTSIMQKVLFLFVAILAVVFVCSEYHFNNILSIPIIFVSRHCWSLALRS